MKRIIMIVLMSLMLSGCMPEPGFPDTKVVYGSRFIDEEAGVVCYIYSGISCLPISETLLEE